MSKRLANIVIAALIVVLGNKAYSIYKSTRQEPAKQVISIKSNEKTKTEIWNEKVDNFKTKINETSKLLVLEGTTDVSITFDDTEYDGKCNVLSWCKTKLANLDAKKLTIDTKYKFGYAYDISKAVVENVTEGKLKVTLYQSQLNVEYLEEVKGEQVISSEKAIFATQFTPSEVAGLTDRVHTYTWNNIINNSDIRLNAIESTKTNIKSIAMMFGFTDLEIKVIGDGLLNNDYSKLNNIKYTLK